jgi:hypothetical protein
LRDLPLETTPPHFPALLVRDRNQLHLTAHYGEFVQWERRKANGQFGAKRTGISVMPNGVGSKRWRVEATSVSMVDPSWWADDLLAAIVVERRFSAAVR